MSTQPVCRFALVMNGGKGLNSMHEVGDGGRLSDVALAIDGACEGRLNPETNLVFVACLVS